ncbi:hypothetical protein [Euzebya tangerina]|uniref:hypothetical protein n=1 Tax=Euzebya tangerina TaxID=591198 RepID=UPI000E311AD9|nr:hypothetical protein [Euzebya tangerina]
MIDFQGLDRDTIVRCAPQPVESGFDALERAGVATTRVTQQPLVVCRLEGVPADDPCASMPAADFYWSYWHAEGGGEWTYSDDGAATRRPPPGSVEGWSFVTDAGRSDTTPPRDAPPAPTSADETNPDGDGGGSDADAPQLPTGDPADDEPAPPALGDNTSGSSGSDGTGSTSGGSGAPGGSGSNSGSGSAGSGSDGGSGSASGGSGSGGSSGSAGPGSSESGPESGDQADDPGAADQDDATTPDASAEGADEEASGPTNARPSTSPPPSPRPSAFDAAPPEDAPSPLPSDDVALLDLFPEQDRPTDLPTVFGVAGAAGAAELADQASTGPPPDTLAGISLLLIMGNMAGLAAYRRREAPA